MPPVAVIEPEKILKELRELWVQLGQQQDTPGGVLRACAMTLVVAAEPDDNGREGRLVTAPRPRTIRCLPAN